MILAVDFGSGGVSAACFDADLQPGPMAEEDWLPAGTLSAHTALEALERTLGTLRRAAPGQTPDALVLSSMMHTLLLTDDRHTPLTPVFTWQDRTGFSRATAVREALGTDYSARTGCWFHPSFPVYRWARLMSERRSGDRRDLRVHSLRSWIQEALTGVSTEDVSTASASGLLNLRDGDWDRCTLDAVGLDPRFLPPVVGPPTVVGELGASTARRCDLPSGLPVVAGGGDGFLAALGSGCERGDRFALTLGTSSAVRRFLDLPEDVGPSGLFCYRYSADRFLVGAASSNGGNVLDWARSSLEDDRPRANEPPVFLPWVHGERAPFWDAGLEPRWLGLSEAHKPGDLHQAVREGVVFTMAAHCRLAAGETSAKLGVLSGNGFRDGTLSRILARLVPFPLCLPEEPGLATLRGAARVGFQALGVETTHAAEALVRNAAPVEPAAESGLGSRFDRFLKAYRSSKSEA
jgi:gluconokinase